MNKKIDAVLFDFDGTVADTDELIVQSMYLMYDLYRNGFKTDREKIYTFSGPNIEDTLKSEFPKGDIELLKREFSKISKALYPSLMKIYPGCKETILEFKNNGIKVGLVTNKNKQMALYCLELIGLKDVFDVVIGFNDVSKGKPDGEGIIKAINTLGVKDLQKVLYVGDNKIDFDTAVNAGVKSAIVLWGPRKFPEGIEPNYRIKDYDDLRRKVLYE
ncbi:MAG: HAD-IA family hydrolase [Bacilli bacterium]|nr:HAD-IA family hydrolase [Bacilli bacterium]